MKRFGNWAVILATLMAVASVGISALANPAPEAAPMVSAASCRPELEAPGRRTARAIRLPRQRGLRGLSRELRQDHRGHQAWLQGQRARARVEAGMRVVPRARGGARQRPGQREADPVEPGDAPTSPTASARPATTAVSTRSGTAASTRTATSSASTATASTPPRGRR